MPLNEKIPRTKTESKKFEWLEIWLFVCKMFTTMVTIIIVLVVAASGGCLLVVFIVILLACGIVHFCISCRTMTIRLTEHHLLSFEDTECNKQTVLKRKRNRRSTTQPIRRRKSIWRNESGRGVACVMNDRRSRIFSLSVFRSRASVTLLAASTRTHENAVSGE